MGILDNLLPKAEPSPAEKIEQLRQWIAANGADLYKYRTDTKMNSQVRMTALNQTLSERKVLAEVLKELTGEILDEELKPVATKKDDGGDGREKIGANN